MTKHSKTQPVARESASIPEDQLSRLRICFPEAFTEGKVDITKLQDTLGDIVETSPERYSFSWAGKKEAIRILQTPSRATLIPSNKESVKFDEAQNLFIEGDNLEVLKLLYKPYFGKVKMIYLDPPYNTGSDFIYPDNYADPLDPYLKLTGQKDADGNLLTSNPDTNGRYHSSWLSMMYPRLFLARQLLSNDGVIFVSIDDHEVHNLRLVMNEVFGEENFRNTIVVRRGIKNVQAQFESISNLASGHEYLHCFTKDQSFRFPLLSHDMEGHQAGKWDTFWRGTDRPTMRFELFGQTPKTGQWRWSKDRTTQAVKNYEQFKNDYENKLSLDDYFLEHYQSTHIELDFVRLNEENVVQYYVPPREYKLISDNWMDLSIKGNEIGFDTEKHIELMKRMIKWITKDSDYILDFFGGSCTTAEAVLEANQEDGGSRKFIMVQLPETISEGTAAYNDGFKTIADMGKERIRRAVKKLKTEDGFKVFHLTESNYRPWTGVEERDPAALVKQMEAFNDPLVEGWKPENVLYEIAIKEGFSLNIQVEHVEAVKGQEVHRVTDPDREQSFYLCLDDKLNIDALPALKLTQDDLFICRDVALDDTAAANLALQCRLKTI